MVEWLELRVLEQHADRVFEPHEGKRLSSGLIRRVRIRTDDPRLERVEEWQRRLRERDDSFFLGWNYIRRYRAQDVENATAFRLCEFATFEPEGESCGTIYNDREACGCGVPRRQLGPLRLRGSSIPRGVHLARTIAGEVIISRSLLVQLESRGILDIPTEPVFSGSSELSEWRQLLTSNGDLEIGADTEAGNGPFDRGIDWRYTCLGGCVRGLALLSELTLSGEGLNGRNIGFTRARFGVRRGVLVPEPEIVISPAFRSVLIAGFNRRCRLEVVHQQGARHAA